MSDFGFPVCSDLMWWRSDIQHPLHPVRLKNSPRAPALGRTMHEHQDLHMHGTLVQRKTTSEPIKQFKRRRTTPAITGVILLAERHKWHT